MPVISRLHTSVTFVLNGEDLQAAFDANEVSVAMESDEGGINIPADTTFAFIPKREGVLGSAKLRKEYALLKRAALTFDVNERGIEQPWRTMYSRIFDAMVVNFSPNAVSDQEVVIWTYNDPRRNPAPGTLNSSHHLPKEGTKTVIVDLATELYYNARDGTLMRIFPILGELKRAVSRDITKSDGWPKQGNDVAMWKELCRLLKKAMRQVEIAAAVHFRRNEDQESIVLVAGAGVWFTAVVLTRNELLNSKDYQLPAEGLVDMFEREAGWFDQEDVLPDIGEWVAVLNEASVSPKWTTPCGLDTPRADEMWEKIRAEHDKIAALFNNIV